MPVSSTVMVIAVGCGLRGDGDPASGGRVLHGVVDEILENLAEQTRGTLQGRNFRRAIAFERDSCASGA